MDAADAAQITDALRDALSAQPGRARDVVAEFGWYELMAEEPEVAVSSLFTLAGELLLPRSQLDSVLLAAAGEEFGGIDARVVLPPPGTSRPAGSRVDAHTVELAGVVQAGTTPILVALRDDDGRHSLVMCDAPDDAPGDPLDTAAGWVRATATASVSTTVDVADATAAWAAMVAAGRRALSHELVGVGSAMMRMTVEHVGSREQFNQPLGSFQAVKHQLADVHLWHQIAELSAGAAWENADGPSAALAKAAAIRSSRSARAVCQQLLGGMGFTWEHDFHRYLRRALTLEPLLGGAAELHAELGAVLRSGDLSESLVAL
ncbi:Acyl-CoA dehydrogenase FadE28 [Mycolicibacterium vanbaalenii]|uniref:Acyl-CoA dehydrogenase FadE28 n=1 Tax=Mycolicibacterium vanbaalenii TaxID=110539 RepID=A0A5S9R6A7_MYCVN|nr:acyl-CoA dehydrogenase family protein [Mycolicibacterium vanbaalenii]CAA0129955.1 Acyl-CoA dehydrogenase FadE28 [Mycolicibacterium vanbaalenii]